MAKVDRRFWVIEVEVGEDGGRKGFLSEPVSPAQPDRLADSGILVFNEEDEARAFIDERHPGSGYKPRSLRLELLLEMVDSEREGSPDLIFYLGGYHLGDSLGGAPLTTDHFRDALAADE